jgi:hypothetical protein
LPQHSLRFAFARIRMIYLSPAQSSLDSTIKLLSFSRVICNGVQFLYGLVRDAASYVSNSTKAFAMS